MGSVVIAMPKTEDAKRMAGMLRQRGVNVDLACSTGAEALKCVDSRDYGIVICGYRLQDMSHMDLLSLLPDYFDMITLTSESKAPMCADGVEKVTMPLQIQILLDTIDRVMSRIEKKVRHDKKGPGSRSEEDRLIIEQAQSIIMNERGMGRIESYRYIQKRSMDSSMSMVEMSKKLIAEASGNQ